MKKITALLLLLMLCALPLRVSALDVSAHSAVLIEAESGKIIFGIICGMITVFIRRFTPIADGALFAVGIASIFSQVIDNFTGNNYFSFIADKKSKELPQKTDLESLLKDEE